MSPADDQPSRQPLCARLTFTPRERVEDAALAESLGAVAESIRSGEHGPRAHESSMRSAAQRAAGSRIGIGGEVRGFMGGDLRVARRLHLGARRRQRCRGRRIFRRDRVRYAPPNLREMPAPPRLPLPVRGASPGSPRIGPVGLPMRLQPALARASVAARAHRRARSAEHVHLSAPTTPPKSTFHAPLLLHRAAGRARRSRRMLPRGGRALNAFTTKARVTRHGDTSPSRCRDRCETPPS